jgi:hypothetical protein
MVEVRLHTNRRPPVRVIIDPADSLELAEFVGGLHDLEHGRVVCHPLPGGTGERWLAFDILAALGKDLTSFGAEHVGMRGWWWAELWLRAEEIGDVFVLRTHLLNERARERLFQLQLACGFRLWLIGARALQPDLLKRWEPCEVNAAAFVARWQHAASTCGQPGNTHADSFPSVPEVTFLTFRAACRRVLARAEFDRVDAVFSDTVRAALGWLREQQPRLQAVRQLDLELSDPQTFIVNDRYRPNLEMQARLCQEGVWLQCLNELATFLESELSVPSSTEATVRLRAIQVACFRFGLLLHIAGSVSGQLDRQVARSELDAATLARLRTLSSPYLAAAAALAVLTSSGAEVLSQLSLACVDRKASRANQATLAMPRSAQPLVRAHVLERRAEGASDEAPVFAEADGHPTSQRVLTRRLQQVARRLAVHIPGASLPGPSVFDCLQQPGAVVRLPIIRLAVADL